jgi:hypothetical protein
VSATTTTALARALGVGDDLLMRWVRDGVLAPTVGDVRGGTGHAWRWGDEAQAHARVLVALRRAGHRHVDTLRAVSYVLGAGFARYDWPGLSVLVDPDADALDALDPGRVSVVVLTHAPPAPSPSRARRRR